MSVGNTSNSTLDYKFTYFLPAQIIRHYCQYYRMWCCCYVLCFIHNLHLRWRCDWCIRSVLFFRAHLPIGRVHHLNRQAHHQQRLNYCHPHTHTHTHTHTHGNIQHSRIFSVEKFINFAYLHSKGLEAGCGTQHWKLLRWENSVLQHWQQPSRGQNYTNC